MPETVSVTVRLRNKRSGVLSNAVTATATVGSLLIGMDVPLGAEWDAAVVDYPGIRYTRDFGKDNVYVPFDADTATEPTPYGQGKWLKLPSNAVMHLSWKDTDPGLTTKLLDSFPATMPAGFPGIVLSPFHEPADDVRKGTLTAAAVRAQGAQIATEVAAHPKGYLVKGIGPIVQRYDLDEMATNPTDYGFAGMTHYFIDSYMSPTNVGSYWSTAKMFDLPIAKIRAAYPGIRIGFPEYGLSKQDNDTTGQARATAIRSHIDYLKALSYVDWIAYFNSPGSIPAVPFTKTSPEGIAYKDLLVTQ